MTAEGVAARLVAKYGAGTARAIARNREAVREAQFEDAADEHDTERAVNRATRSILWHCVLAALPRRADAVR